MTRAWEPCHLCEVELAGAIKDLQAPNRTEGGLYSRARILVRLHRQPLGLVEVALPATAEVLTDQIWKALANSINRHLVQDGQAALTHLTPRGVEPLEAPACQQQRLAAAAAAVPVTIVVCTRDRSALLARALDSLLPQTEQPNEILVVDNAPATSETADLAEALCPVSAGHAARFRRAVRSVPSAWHGRPADPAPIPSEADVATPAPLVGGVSPGTRAL